MIAQQPVANPGGATLGTGAEYQNSGLPPATTGAGLGRVLLPGVRYPQRHNPSTVRPKSLGPLGCWGKSRSGHPRCSRPPPKWLGPPSFGRSSSLRPRGLKHLVSCLWPRIHHGYNLKALVLVVEDTLASTSGKACGRRWGSLNGNDNEESPHLRGNPFGGATEQCTPWCRP